MITRAEADPDLHVLRSALSLVEGRERSALEAARFGLFVAYDQCDEAAGRRWADAVRAALLAIQPSDERGRMRLDLAERALARLEDGCR